VLFLNRTQYVLFAYVTSFALPRASDLPSSSLPYDHPPAEPSKLSPYGKALIVEAQENPKAQVITLVVACAEVFPAASVAATATTDVVEELSPEKRKDVEAVDPAVLPFRDML
jgi:hypothetical protein